ncbi:MAG TPA: hypothetical protein VFW85_04995 [Gaiellaceae bacterium]|nr:hypothetical protein [Gaiellaceae bacterium]
MTLAITTHDGGRIAELAFLLIAIAGASLFFGQVPFFGRARNSVAGLCLGAAGVLLIVAAHWGHFG